jgi:hypothetical protein
MGQGGQVLGGQAGLIRAGRMSRKRKPYLLGPVNCVASVAVEGDQHDEFLNPLRLALAGAVAALSLAPPDIL